MRTVIQRVSSARVTVDGQVVGEIGRGLLVLAAVHQDDSEAAVEWMARKLPDLRIFTDEAGKMNLSVREVEGSILLVSQFTLYGECRKGRRPNFMGSAPPDRARQLLERLEALLRGEGVPVATGRFGAMMDVALTNDGPVTLLLDSPPDAA